MKPSVVHEKDSLNSTKHLLSIRYQRYFCSEEKVPCCFPQGKARRLLCEGACVECWHGMFPTLACFRVLRSSCNPEEKKHTGFCLLPGVSTSHRPNSTSLASQKQLPRPETREIPVQSLHSPGHSCNNSEYSMTTLLTLSFCKTNIW